MVAATFRLCSFDFKHASQLFWHLRNHCFRYLNVFLQTAVMRLSLPSVWHVNRNSTVLGAWRCRVEQDLTSAVEVPNTHLVRVHKLQCKNNYVWYRSVKVQTPLVALQKVFRNLQVECLIDCCAGMYSQWKLVLRGKHINMIWSFFACSLSLHAVHF